MRPNQIIIDDPHEPPPPAYPPDIVTAEHRAAYDRQFAAGFAARIAHDREQEEKRLQARGKLPLYAGTRHQRRAAERGLKKRIAKARRIGQAKGAIENLLNPAPDRPRG